MNNRQAGRRRGRGGQRQGGNPGRPDNGNRIDNRARGNAAQLLEKYKNLAQDAQRSGDRVTTEYYLQFADHYFRVLAESRSRFEENNARRQPQDGEGDDGDEDYGYEGEAVSPAAHGQRPSFDDDGADEPRRPRERDGQGGNRREREPREAREPREPREYREPREARGDREDRGENRRERNRNGAGRDAAVGDAGEREGAELAEARRPQPANDSDVGEPAAEPRRRGRPRRVAEPAAQADTGLDAAVLPPSISVEAEVPAAEERPRRGRPRRVRSEDEVIPPAA